MRILLVDDDASVLQALLAVLNTLPGHDIRTAGVGGEALAAANQMEGADLLITDVVMEPMDGFTLRDRLTTKYPGLRTILISGYDLSDYPEQVQGYQLLTKPIDPDALLAAVAGEFPAPAVAEREPEPELAPVAEAGPETTEAAEPALEETPVEPAAPEPVAEPEPTPAPAATPVAVPTAVPVSARPVAVPVARPTAVPVARPAVSAPAAAPTARATAVPAAAPVAVPRAVPAGQPAATVKATAVPRPSPVAVPVPTTPPATSPSAPPPSTASPNQPTVRVTATVKAKPIPPPSAPGVPASAIQQAPGTAVPTARAVPSGQPVKATAVPTPRSGLVETKALSPVPTPRPPTAPSTVSIPVSAPPDATLRTETEPVATGSSEDLSGRMLGAYQLHRKLNDSRWGSIYAGLQTSINRPVAIEVLDPATAADPASQARFVADARAKAAVQHPSILAVYEAGESDERFFYAYEYVDGQTIADVKEAGDRLDEPTALKVMRVAADGLSYFNVHHTPHTPPDAASISIGTDGHPRLANLATQLADETLTPPQEIQALGRVMLGVLPAIQSLSPGLRDMLKRMVQPGPQALNSWGQLLQGIKALEPKIVPTDAAKISAQDRAAIAAVELARKQQKRSLYYNLASVVTLLALVVVAVWYFMFRNKQRIYDEQVMIPAGTFLFANGESKELPDFWIDKYEVTYGEYAKFVKSLEDHPTTEFDHKQQPRSKNSAMHKPPQWDIYYGNAREGRAARSIPIDLSCPVMEVDFWDAWAYAKWKGRDLPTEEEWEKAGRGTAGFIYPWGEDFDPKKVNSNADYNEADPAAKGQIDGYNCWNPVDKVKGDKSPFGVIGMAGNVREWTNTWDKAKNQPIVKGGSYKASDVRLDHHVDADPNSISEALGFRTVSHTPPTTK